MISKSKDNGGNVNWISVLSRHWHCTYLLLFRGTFTVSGKEGKLDHVFLEEVLRSHNKSGDIAYSIITNNLAPQHVQSRRKQILSGQAGFQVW